MRTRTKLVLALVALAVVVAVVGWRRPRGTVGSRPTPTAVLGGASPTASAAPDRGSAPGDIASVHRLAPEQRRQLGEQIAASIRRARSSVPPAQPGGAPTVSDHDPIIRLEQVGKPLRDALQASIPILAECYQQQGGGSTQAALAVMTMASDPELGTVIDTDAVKDADGKPLDPKLEACLRDAIDSLALPPLGEPGRLPLQYTFRFGD